MSTLVKHHRAKDVVVEAEKLVVFLEDGREIAVPLSWFPRLQQASVSARENWELIGRGLGIHWPDIDEHVSVESLLHPERTIASRETGDGEGRTR